MYFILLKYDTLIDRDEHLQWYYREVTTCTSKILTPVCRLHEYLTSGHFRRRFDIKKALKEYFDVELTSKLRRLTSIRRQLDVDISTIRCRKKNRRRIDVEISTMPAGILESIKGIRKRPTYAI